MITLSKTQSICPVCHEPVEAEYVLEAGKVLIRKKCPEHGEVSALVARNPQDYIRWTKHPVVNIPPKVNITKGAEGECPLHCGTCENHLQTACCVLIDVTDRCNQHCPYCFAKAEDAGNDMPLSEIERKYDLLLELGEEREFNIQLSGGEPTVRDDLPEIIRMGRDKGFEYIQINTNGRRIAEEKGYAKKLKDAGVSVIYLQFDGTTDEIYMQMRNEPLLHTKLSAIENCRRAGLPVTLVPTVVKNINLDNIGEMMRFLIANRDVVKGIHFQPVSFFGRVPDKDYENRVTMFDCMRAIEEQTDGLFKTGDLCPITTGHTMCCFYGTYLREKDGSIRSLITEQTRKTGVSCCDSHDPLEIIRKDRDFVLNKWDLPEYEETDEDCCSCGEAEEESSCCCGEAPAEESCCCCADEPVDLDEFITCYKSNMFTVSGMAFMDLSNLDAERLKRCRVVQLTDDDRLIPFCAYNSIYRK